MGMGEDNRLERIFQEKQFAKLLDQGYAKAVETLEEDGEINPNDFENFDPEIVGKDIAYVARMEERFKKEDSPKETEAAKLAAIFEAIIHEQVELSDWLGFDVSTIKASRYDDIKNGVDSIAEFQGETSTSYLALAIDVTYGDPLKKLEKIKQEINTGCLSEVKYFKSSDGGFRGSLYQVPRVVVGADKQAVMDLLKIWLDKSRKRELENHPIQLQILDEIALQLENFRKYALSRGKEEISKKFAQQLFLVEQIRSAKAALYKKQPLDYKENDSVFRTLERNMDMFQK